MTTHKTCSIINQLTTRQTPHLTRMILGAMVGKTNQSLINRWSSISSHCWDKWCNKWLINITLYQGTMEQALTLTLHTKMNASLRRRLETAGLYRTLQVASLDLSALSEPKLCWRSLMITHYFFYFSFLNGEDAKMEVNHGFMSHVLMSQSCSH